LSHVSVFINADILLSIITNFFPYEEICILG